MCLDGFGEERLALVTAFGFWSYTFCVLFDSLLVLLRFVILIPQSFESLGLLRRRGGVLDRTRGVGLVWRRLWCSGIAIDVRAVCPIRLGYLEGTRHAAWGLGVDIHGVRHGGECGEC